MKRDTLIYLSRLPRKARERFIAKQNEGKPKPKAPPSEPNAFLRFNKKVSEAVVEALDVGTTQAWLNRAYQTILNRSTSISNLSEKDQYVKLASVVQAAIPVNNASADNVEQNLQILRQQITITEQDSEGLRKLKSHLISSIGEVLSPTEGEAPGGEAAPEGGEEMGGPPGGEMGGEEMGGPPPEEGGAPPPAGGPAGTENPPKRF
jgi:hypothetical protein